MNGLKYIMLLEDFSTADVAKRLKVNRSLISIWQTGRRPIPDSRIRDLAGVFPKYPAYYFNKELTNDDMVYLQNLKSGSKSVVQPQRDQRMSQVESIIQEQMHEQGQVLTEVAEILKVENYASLLKNANNMGDKQILSLLFTVIGVTQQSYLHDYRIINKLEQLKRRAEANGEEDLKLSLIGIAMSALAVSFGFEDDVAALAAPNSLRAILPPEAVEIDPNVKRFTEWRDRISSVFKEIIDCCDNEQRKVNEMNERLRKGKMIIEFLEDIIKDTPERKRVEEHNSHSNNLWHSSYDVTRENDISDCEIITQGSDLFENVGKLLISDRSEECTIMSITIKPRTNEISCIGYINGDEEYIEEDVSQNVFNYLTPTQVEEYHKLCNEIIESAMIYL